MYDETDIDAAICYYAYINHGTLPHEIMDCNERERAFIYAMTIREIKAREKLDKGVR